MVICPLGTEKKYIIHISRDPKIALNTWYVQNFYCYYLKKKDSFLLLSPEVQRFHALKKKIKKIYFYCVQVEKMSTKNKKK